MSGWMRGLLVVALLCAGFALKGLLFTVPSTPSTLFDSDRAVARLQRILGDQRPHPVDSADDDAVRARLIAELAAIGLQSRVQETIDCSALPKTRLVSCSRVHNVIAVVPGVKPGPQLLLNAHYDSTPTGPGAADDGLGVAVLLEVASTLKAAPPPRPVTLLFNEGEEFGLNGAHAFLRDPQAKQVNSLINVDNRGVTGPALMHETSDPNGAALAIYARATRRPFANSISTDFAKLIPNYTDVSFFKPAGWTLLNYGIIGNETRYHSPGDTVQALDRRSLAHVGSEVLASIEALAATPNPARAASGNMVFSDIAGQVLIRLPLTVAVITLGLLLAAALILAWRRHALGKPLLLAAATTIGGTLAAAALGFGLSTLRAGDFWRAYPLVPYLALYAVMLLAMTAIILRWGRNIDRDRMRVASWLLTLLFGTATCFVLPGATIYFLFAPTLGLLGAALTGSTPRAATVLAISAVVIQFVMFAELIAAIEMLLIDGPLAAVAPLAALAALPALVEADTADYRPSTWLLALLSGGLAIAALVMPRASTERPLGFSIDYFREAGGKTASWGIATKQAPLPAGYPGKWRKDVLPYNARTRWVSPAPLLQTPIPSAKLIDSSPAGSGRRLLIALSPGGGNNISIRFPKGAKIVALGLPGAPEAIPARGEPDQAALRCAGRSCEGLQIEVLIGDRRPLDVELFSTRFGLPPEGHALQAARPANAIPQYAPDQTITRARARL